MQVQVNTTEAAFHNADFWTNSDATKVHKDGEDTKLQHEEQLSCDSNMFWTHRRTGLLCLTIMLLFILQMLLGF